MRPPDPRRRPIAGGYGEVIRVLMGAALGLSVQPPLAWLADHQGINVVLVALVLATAVGVEPAALRRLGAVWPWLVIGVLAGVTVLPALSWAASRLVAAGPLRQGVMVVGLAPCEIASVAIAAMAGGEVAVAAGALVASTVATIAVAGAVVAIEAGSGGGAHPTSTAAHLALVVAVPMATGLCLRSVRAPGPRLGRGAARASTSAVAALVALTAAEVHLSSRYLRVVAALVLFLCGSAAVGWLLGRRQPASVAAAVLLATSMRDFAVAASLAATAFGPAAAGPLGLYGIMVLVWGTAAAGTFRRRAGDGPDAREGGRARNHGDAGGGGASGGGGGGGACGAGRGGACGAGRKRAPEAPTGPTPRWRRGTRRR